jgi:hypothetical protein
MKMKKEVEPADQARHDEMEFRKALNANARKESRVTEYMIAVRNVQSDFEKQCRRIDRQARDGGKGQEKQKRIRADMLARQRILAAQWAVANEAKSFFRKNSASSPAAEVQDDPEPVNNPGMVLGFGHVQHHKTREDYDDGRIPRFMDTIKASRVCEVNQEQRAKLLALGASGAPGDDQAEEVPVAKFNPPHWTSMLAKEWAFRAKQDTQPGGEENRLQRCETPTHHNTQRASMSRAGARQSALSSKPPSGSQTARPSNAESPTARPSTAGSQTARPSTAGQRCGLPQRAPMLLTYRSSALQRPSTADPLKKLALGGAALVTECTSADNAKIPTSREAAFLLAMSATRNLHRTVQHVLEETTIVFQDRDAPQSEDQNMKLQDAQVEQICATEENIIFPRDNVRKPNLQINIGGICMSASSVMLPWSLVTPHAPDNVQPDAGGTPVDRYSAARYIPSTHWHAGGPPGNYHSFLDNRNLRPKKKDVIVDRLCSDLGPDSVRTYLHVESMAKGRPQSGVPNMDVQGETPRATQSFSSITPRCNSLAQDRRMPINLQLKVPATSPNRNPKTRSMPPWASKPQNNNEGSDKLMEESKRILAREIREESPKRGGSTKSFSFDTAPTGSQLPGPGSRKISISSHMPVVGPSISTTEKEDTVAAG